MESSLPQQRNASFTRPALRVLERPRRHGIIITMSVGAKSAVESVQHLETGWTTTTDELCHNKSALRRYGLHKVRDAGLRERLCMNCAAAPSAPSSLHSNRPASRVRSRWHDHHVPTSSSRRPKIRAKLRAAHDKSLREICLAMTVLTDVLLYLSPSAAPSNQEH